MEHGSCVWWPFLQAQRSGLQRSGSYGNVKIQEGRKEYPSTKGKRCLFFLPLPECMVYVKSIPQHYKFKFLKNSGTGNTWGARLQMQAVGLPSSYTRVRSSAFYFFLLSPLSHQSPRLPMQIHGRSPSWVYSAHHIIIKTTNSKMKF